MESMCSTLVGACTGSEWSLGRFGRLIPPLVILRPAFRVVHGKVHGVWQLSCQVRMWGGDHPLCLMPGVRVIHPVGIYDGEYLDRILSWTGGRG